MASLSSDGRRVGEMKEQVERLRRQVVFMQRAVQGLEYEARTKADIEWSDVVNRYKMLLGQLRELREECGPLLQYYVLAPSQIPADMDPNEIPALLSTKELPSMEAAARRAAAARDGRDDLDAVVQHNAMIDDLDAMFAAHLEGLDVRGRDSAAAAEEHARRTAQRRSRAQQNAPSETT